MKIVYADLLLITNLLFDYILLLLSSRLCSQRLCRPRLLLASLFGAVYSLCCCMEGMDFLPSPGGKILSCALICIIAYYGRPNFPRQTAAFLALSAAMGGAMWALGLAGGYPLSLCAVFSGISLALYLLLGQTAAPDKAELVSVEIVFRSKSCTLSAMRDTGNSLTDPLSGEHVIVVTPAALKALFPGCREYFSTADSVALIQCLNLFPDTRGVFRLIPYKALDQSAFVPAFRPDRLTINGKEESYLVAVSPKVHGALYEGIV